MSQPEAPILPPFEQALQQQQQLAEYVRQVGELYSVRVSEREVIRMALLLANECSTAEMLEVIAFVTAGGSLAGASPHFEFVKLLREGAPGDLVLRPEWDKLLRLSWNSLRPERQWMRSAVELVMSNPAAARIKLRDRLEEATHEILISPSITWNGRSLVTELSYFALTVPALTGYAIALLLDDKRGYADKLLRCNIEGCGSIFLSISSGKGGGRPPLSCSPEHRALAVKLSGPARTEKWRKSKAKKAR